MKKIVIIGATSGIGRAVAEFYAQKGFILTITGRRLALLEEIKNKFPQSQISVCQMDISKTEESRMLMQEIESNMGGIDIVLINAGVGYPKANYEQELETIDINARGFMALAQWSYRYFKEKTKGHLVGISSVASIKSSPYSPEYHASKAFMKSYLEGLRLRSMKWHPEIYVTEIRPGFVDTPMTKQNKSMFWVASPEKAASQIFDAVESKKGVAYITKRYVIIAWILRLIPNWLFAKVF